MRTLEQLEPRRLLASFTASSVTELIADINAANGAGGANTITLAPGAAFNLSAADNATDATGLPVVAAGNDLTILGNGDTIQRSTARGTPEFRLFHVAAGASLALSNLTLSGGVAANYGGGVLNQGTLSLSGVTVQNCAVRGRSNDPSLVVGGGIYSDGALAVTNSSIRSNQAVGGDGTIIAGLIGGVGGASAAGGGVCVGGGTATLTNTTISANLARGGAGADGDLLLLWPSDKHGEPVPGGPGGNGSGGGICAVSGTIALRTTTITGNTATGGAGGTSPKSLPKGAGGAGYGGGIFIASGVPASLDAFTQANTRTNTASTSDKDIFGTFTIL